MDVRLPDGTVVRNVPEGTTRSQLMARVSKAPQAPSRRGGITDLLAQGATFGLSDEISGVTDALYNAVKAPFSSKTDFDPVGAYTRGRDDVRAQIKDARKSSPVLGPAAEIIGGIASTPAGIAKGARSLFQTVKQGAKAGAKAGAVAGYGYGEGAENSAGGAVLGAAGGAAIGGALPVTIAVGSKPVRAAANYLRPQNGISRELVVRALADDGITPRAAGEAMDAAQQRGVPLMLGDLGENLRGLTGAVSRKPGASRRLVRAAVNQRQMEQGERVQSALTRDLGPTTYVPQASDDIITRARARAAPLYEEAYARPVVSTPELDAILKTPAGKGALSRARTIAANERRDPEALGFALDKDDNVILNPTVMIGMDDTGKLALSRDPERQRGYTTQTLDYVKRGLDDMIEQFRDPVTRRLNLDESGRAINQVRAQLLGEVDRLNPPYRQARAAYAGEAGLRNALELGRKALTASADDVARMTRPLNSGEQEQFALGLRSAMADHLSRGVDGADKVGRLLGTPKKRAALARAFGGRANFDRFVQTMADERMGNETYRAVSAGSQTAERQAFDETLTDQSLLEDVAGKALKGASNGGMTGAIAELVNATRDLNKFGAGATGQRAREEVAALLSEVDPDALRQIMREAMRQQAIRRAGTGAINRRTAQVGMRAGQLAGAVTGANMTPVE